MQKFQELLTQAAQLKQAQLKNDRKNYESLPEYLKSGLNYSRKYQLLRKQDYLIQMTISQKLKKQGNELFKIQHYPQAQTKYEEALGIFRYILAKSYDNMKDQDLAYEYYVLPQEKQTYNEEYNNHLVALYLNICSCLTKLNKKDDAIHSADEALKLKQTAKAYYKKAQAYLQFINKESSDIKLGFYYLNKSYELSKDPSIVQQMHKIKKEIDQDREKEKKWFKFMFDKNSQNKKEEQTSAALLPPAKEQKMASQEDKKDKSQSVKAQQIKNLQRQKGDEIEKEDVRLEKTKQKLSRFTDPKLDESEWQQLYQGEFIARHGSKIYSIIQLYGYKEYLGEYKALLAQCLQVRKEQSQKRQQLFKKYFQWLKQHPIDKITKYTERYELQTKWIAQQRQKPQLKQEKIEEIHKNDEKIEGELPKIEEKVEMEMEKTEASQLQPQEIQIETVSEQIRAAVQREPIIEHPLSTQPEDKPQFLPQQPLLPHRKDNKLKLYSFLIALFIILILKLFL